MFKPARKSAAKARVAVVGPAGSGKTITALELATGLGKRIALIDTEHESASKYADRYAFDADSLTTHHPDKFIEKIKEAERSGYDVLIIDSLSHAWMGADGALELVDNASKRSKSGNSFNAWRDVTPLHNRLCEAILAAKMHIIATMRAKTEYVLEEINGKKVPRKIGMAPVQRDGMEYLYDIVGDMDLDHNFVVTKSRCFELADKVIQKPNRNLGEQIAAWLSDGPTQPVASPKQDAPPPKQPAASSPEMAELARELGALAKEHGAAWCKEVCGGTPARTPAAYAEAIAKIKDARAREAEAAAKIQSLVDDVFGDAESEADPFEEEAGRASAPPKLPPESAPPPPRSVPDTPPPKKRGPRETKAAEPGASTTQSPGPAENKAPHGEIANTDSAPPEQQRQSFASPAEFWARVREIGQSASWVNEQISEIFGAKSVVDLTPAQRAEFLATITKKEVA